MDTLALAHLYGFVDLEAAISDYLREILNIKNVCSTLDTALLYHLKFLTEVSIVYFYFYNWVLIIRKTIIYIYPFICLNPSFDR